MKSLRLFFLTLLCLLTAVGAPAADVKFVSGEKYQIRCIQWPSGCIMPRPDNAAELIYGFTAGKASWWVITATTDGNYLVRNASTGTYFTWDGQRTAIRRYMHLSPTDEGATSRWDIYVAQTGLLIRNAHHQDHYLDIRHQTYLVGTYAYNTDDMATDNERFFLVDRRGRIVNRFDGHAINLPDACYDAPKTDAAGKAVKGSERTAAQVSGKTGQGTASGGHTAGEQVTGNGMPTTHDDIQTFIRERMNRGTAGSDFAAGRAVRMTAGIEVASVNGRIPVLDAERGIYLCSVPEADLKNGFTARVGYKTLRKGRTYVDGKAGSGQRNRFDNPGGGRVFRLAYVDGTDTVGTALISFTALPIIEVKGTGLSKLSFVPGTFALHDPAARDVDSTLNVRLRYRGDYASLLNKKTLAVKFVDAAGRKQARRWLGLRTDNYWILDAMAVDHARMRNRVAMDLWNDMAVRPYYASKAGEARTGVRGRLVEVFFNGRYAGIYNFTERIDRKQLDLAKTEGTKARGCMYKAWNWGTWSQMGMNRFTNTLIGQKAPRYDNSYDTWAEWEIKYPEPSAKKKAEWGPLYDAVNVVGNTDDKSFAREVGKAFDLPAVVDYYLFIELLHAVDNTGKNMVWAVYDQSRSRMMTPAPWDLDGSFGRSWNGHREDCLATNDFRQWLLKNHIQNGLFERLHTTNAADWNTCLARRYRELRRGAFDPDRLYARFARYFDLMRLSGADTREHRRWAGRDVYIDFPAEALYIRQWIKDRVATLDRRYGY